VTMLTILLIIIVILLFAGGGIGYRRRGRDV
jgi:LPXTG-motif cell wall-anchored protein